METPRIEITKEQINAGQKQTGNIIIIAKAALAVAGSLPLVVAVVAAIDAHFRQSFRKSEYSLKGNSALRALTSCRWH
jgi:hypothetical protein